MEKVEVGGLFIEKEKKMSFLKVEFLAGLLYCTAVDGTGLPNKVATVKDLLSQSTVTDFYFFTHLPLINVKFLAYKTLF